MLCPSCNTSNRDDAKFCKSCGRSFSVSQTEDAINRVPTAETGDTPTTPASPPSASAQNIATVSMGASDENEAIPIPPPPPPMENGAVEGTETSHSQNATYGGVYPDMEKSETMQQPSEQPPVEQSEGAEQA